MLSFIEPLCIEVAARPSLLSKAQVQEIRQALRNYHPSVVFNIHYLSTAGDRDVKQSLRTLKKNDFFTEDLDKWVLAGTQRVAIHSAKDVPLPLPAELRFFCVTSSIDARDALVLLPGFTIDTLPIGARIATSSEARENRIKSLRPDLTFCDIRGNVDERVAKLHRGEIEGVVVAEAALIRLQLTHLHRFYIPGETAKGQGQLAVIGRDNDYFLQDIFSCLHDEAAFKRYQTSSETPLLQEI